jgi:hypothetical protein
VKLCVELVGVVLIKAIGWGDVLGAGVAGLMAGYIALRVWQNKPINPRSTLAVEEKVLVFALAMLPWSIMWLLACVLACRRIPGPGEPMVSQPSCDACLRIRSKPCRCAVVSARSLSRALAS